MPCVRTRSGDLPSGFALADDRQDLRGQRVQELANPPTLVVAPLVVGERLHDESERGSAEGPRDEILHDAFLHLALRLRWAIDLRPYRTVANQRAFVGHDLHELEHGGVAGGALLRERPVD